MEVCETEEWTRSWCSGSDLAAARSSSVREGCKIFCVHVLRAASNWREYISWMWKRRVLAYSHNGDEIAGLVVQSIC